MSDAFELEICQGKYRYRYEAGKQEVWRNGEPWAVMNGRLIGDKFVFSLAVELDEALKERDILREKIEATEKERDDVAQQLVQAERGKRAISEECDALRNELASVKEVEFPKKAQAVADAWKGKCKRLEAERDALRAAIKASASSRNEKESMACKSDAGLSDEALWAGIAASMITPAHIARPSVAEQDQINAEAAIRSIYGTPSAPLPNTELLARIEAAERERDWHAERCEDAMNECVALRSKIEAVENEVRRLKQTIEAQQLAWGSQAMLDVIAERRRQIEVEGWTPEHDDEHSAHALTEAAACYCLSSAGKPFDYFETVWPWERWWFKASGTRRDLIKAGALILAEVERLDRAAEGGENKGVPGCASGWNEKYRATIGDKLYTLPGAQGE